MQDVQGKLGAETFEIRQAPLHDLIHFASDDLAALPSAVDRSPVGVRSKESAWLAEGAIELRPGIMAYDGALQEIDVDGDVVFENLFVGEGGVAVEKVIYPLAVLAARPIAKDHVVGQAIDLIGAVELIPEANHKELLRLRLLVRQA